MPKHLKIIALLLVTLWAFMTTAKLFAQNQDGNSGRGELASGPIVNPYNHHTYILLQPATWKRSEQLAKNWGAI